MQVFNAFMKVLRKRIGTAMIWVVIFLIISFTIANNADTGKLKFESTKMDICVFDEDNTEASKALTEFLGKKHNIVTVENDKDHILDALYYGRADYIMTIKEGYEQKLAAGDTEELFTSYHVHDSYEATLAENLTNEYVGTVNAYLIGGEEMSSALTKTEKALSQEVKVTTETFDKGKKSDGPDEKFFYFQYLPYVFISVMIVALCPVLLKLNQKEIKHRTNCSCITARSQSAQIILGSTVFVLAVWLIFMIAGAVMFGGIYTGRMWYAVLNSFIFIVISAGISILISAFSPAENVVNVIANIIGLGMSFLCGVFVEQNLLGDGVLNAARFLPAFWYIKANDMLAGTTGEVFSKSKLFEYMGIEALFAVAIFAAVIIVMKVNHDKAD
ncbi:MAG: ABC transporter permease [Ruminococcus sp.]|nr:ABC transporter permease [Ruminococcus sp.]